jgi:hypothetical protein
VTCLSSSTLAKEDAPDRWPPVSPSAIVPAQDFDRTVVPITELKLLGMEGEFGTGCCLDPTCRFIATNYHVAMMARPRKIRGEKVVQLYLATGADDEGATVNDGPCVSPLKYTLSRDLAIFELRHSLPHHHLSVSTICKLACKLTCFLILKKPAVPSEASCSFTARSKGKPPPACLRRRYTSYHYSAVV